MAFLMRVGVLCLLLWNNTEEIVGTEICSKNDFSCGDDDCISILWICDGDEDCLNSADEQNCTKVCTTDQFRCDNKTRCIDISWRCDGEFDCIDHTDEDAHCNNICGYDQYMCENHDCISNSLKCDGNKDCLEGSDENDCPMTTLSSDPESSSSTSTSKFIENKMDTNNDSRYSTDMRADAVAEMTTLSSDPESSSSTSTSKFIENKVDTDNDHRYSTDMRADPITEMTTLASGSEPSSSTNTSKFIENKVDTNNDHRYSTDMRADPVAEMTTLSSGPYLNSSTSTSKFIEDKVDKDNKRILTLVLLLSVGGSFIVISAVTVVICIIKRRARKRQMPNNKNNSYPMLDVVPNRHTCASNNPTYGITDTNMYEGLDRRGNASSEDLYQQLGYSNRDIMSAHLESQYVNTGTCYQQSHPDRRECSKDNNDENVTQMHPSNEYESL